MSKNYTTMEELEKELGEYTKGESLVPIIGSKAKDIVISHKDLREKPVKPLKYILHPIIPEDGYLLLHAAAGVGKTYFALNIAYAIAQGGRFLEFVAPEPKKILYIDSEMGQDAVHRRMEKIESIQGKLYFDNLHYLFYDNFPNGKMPKIDTISGRQFYITYLIENNFDGVVFDNLKTMTTMDENKTKEWDEIQDDLIIFLRKKNIFTILLHHSCSGDPSKQRGTSARIDVAHFVISLQAFEDENGKKNKIKFNYQKTRETEGVSFVDFIVLNNFDGSFKVLELENEFEQKVYYYYQRGVKKPMDIQRAIEKDGVKCYPKKVYRAFEELEKKGYLTFIK